MFFHKSTFHKSTFSERTLSRFLGFLDLFRLENAFLEHFLHISEMAFKNLLSFLSFFSLGFFVILFLCLFLLLYLLLFLLLLQYLDIKRSSTNVTDSGKGGVHKRACGTNEVVLVQIGVTFRNSLLLLLLLLLLFGGDLLL